MQKELEAMFFACLRAAVTDQPLADDVRSKMDDEHQQAIYRLAKKHDVAHLIAYTLQKESVEMTEAARRTLHRVQMASIYRMQLLLLEQERICTALENASIPHILLKGAVLRNFYPKSWMRTSCDIDILTPYEKVDVAAEILKSELGYKIEKKLDHDVQIFAPNGTHLELHFTLCINRSECDTLLEKAWEYAQPTDGKHASMALDFEFHLLYFLAHIAKHVFTGGCGVKPFLDLFVLRTAHCYDEARLVEFCKQAGLLTFYQACCRLCDVWFADGSYTETDRSFADYVLGAGVYGTSENYTNITSIQKGGKLAYIRYRLFPPAESIFSFYPSARRWKILLPIYYIRRLFRFFLPSRHKALVAQLKQTASLKKQTSNELADLLSKLGLY